MNNFVGCDNFEKIPRKIIEETQNSQDPIVVRSMDELFKHLKVFDNMTISYHHHLRNGDTCVNMIMEYFYTNFQNTFNIAASSIFPSHSKIVDLIENSRINNIYCNYINGPVAKVVSKGLLNEMIYLHTHGGRARAIEAGEIAIDIAFIAASQVDNFGNANGIYGKSACGSLGYAVSDAKFAKTKVLITDNLVDNVDVSQIQGKYVDYILVVDKIGDPTGIVSGTTQVTKNPVGLKIARDSARLINEVGLLKDGISFQTGAGGASLAVASYLKEMMVKRGIRGSFASGGITGYFTSMLEQDMFDELWDVQCFDLAAIQSLAKNSKHHYMSASKYANPYDNPVVNNLDIVVLGATEIDIDFNVNVVTDSNNNLMGGSGGHSDTAYGAKLTIVVSPLIKGRNPIVKNRVNTITTPGDSVDVFVTERGIAINPKRVDLIEKLASSSLNILSIEQLQKIAHKICGVPLQIEKSDKVIGYVVYRDGTIIDEIRGVVDGL